MDQWDGVSIRLLTDEEIEEEIERAHDEIARLKYRAAFEQLENPLLLRTRRRDLARLKTIQHERASVVMTEEQVDV